MSDRPVFLYAAVYDSIADAEADYEAVFDLHALGAIGTFDSAVIRKEEDGKVRVGEADPSTVRGPARASARSSGSSSRRRSSAPRSSAPARAVIGHLRKGISRGDLKEFGDELENGTAAVVVIGESKLEEQLENAMKRADKLVEESTRTPRSSSARSTRPPRRTPRRPEGLGRPGAGAAPTTGRTGPRAAPR